MKSLVTLILLLIASISYSQEYTIAHINAHWNNRNDVDLPLQILGYKVIKGDLEDQHDNLKKEISAVPVVILFRDGKVATFWRAGISLKLNLTVKEIEDAIRKDKQAYQRARSN